MTFVASPRIRSVGCIYADRCVYAPDAAYTHMCLYAVVGAYTRVGAYTHPSQGAYTRVGAFTRAVGACTQWVRIHTRVRIRGWVRIREWWVRIHRGCVYAPPRVYTGFRVYAPPTAYTQESTNRNGRMVFQHAVAQRGVGCVMCENGQYRKLQHLRQELQLCR